MKEKTWILEGNPFDYTARIINDKLYLARNDHKAFFDFNKEDVLNVKNLSRITGSNNITHCITVNIDNSIKIGCCTISNTKYKEICEELTKDLIQIKTKDMKFKVGDKVKISASSEYYRDNDINNPKSIGVVTKNSIYSIYVNWNNGTAVNSYGESDLELVDMIDIMNMEEVQQYKVLKGFNDQKIGDIIKVVDLNATVQWKDTNNFLVQTTVKDLLANGFIELSLKYKKGDWVYMEDGISNPLKGVYKYEGSDLEGTTSCSLGVLYYEDFEDLSIYSEFRPNFSDLQYIKRLATKEEVKKALIEIAKEKGYKVGTKIKAPVHKYVQIINRDGFRVPDNDTITISSDRFDSEMLSGDYLYSKGEWAEIIEQTQIEEKIEIVGYEPVFNSNGTVSIGCNKDIPAEVFKGLKAIQDFCIKIGYSDHVKFTISRGNISWNNPNENDCTKGVHDVVKKLK